MPASVWILFAFMFVLSIVTSVALRQKDGTGSSRGQRRAESARPDPLGRIVVAPALRRLLEDLEEIAEDAPALHEQRVRELLRDVVDQAFVVGDAEYAWPERFGLASEEAEARVRAALARFLAETRPAIGEEGLATPQERQQAFENPTLVTRRGSLYGTFFGFS